MIGRNASFYNFVINLFVSLNEPKSVYLNKYSKDRFDLKFTKAFELLDIPENSKIEIKYLSNSKLLTYLIKEFYTRYKNEENLYLVVNASDNELEECGINKSAYRIISLDDLYYLNTKRYIKNNRAKKNSSLLNCDDLNQFLIFFIRASIVKGYLADINETPNLYEIRSTKNKSVFPFCYKNIYFFERNNFDYEENSYLEKVQVSSIKKYENYTCLFIGDRYCQFLCNKEVLAHAISDFYDFSDVNFKITEEKFYKYKGISFVPHIKPTEYFLNILDKKEIYFAPKKNLNDPFDVDIREVTAHYDKLKDKYVADKYKPVDSNYLVLSLSHRFDNLVMWSHYANSHKGCCFKYDKYLINRNIHLDPNIMFGIYGNVSYQKERPKFSSLRSYSRLLPKSLCDFVFNIKCLFTKMIDWSYEEECRYIIVTKTKHSDGYSLVNDYEEIYTTEDCAPLDVAELRKRSKVVILKKDAEEYKLI